MSRVLADFRAGSDVVVVVEPDMSEVSLAMALKKKPVGGSGGASQLHYEVSSFLSFIRHEVERVADSASTKMVDRPYHNRDTEWLDSRELCFCLLDELRLTLRLTGRFSDIPVDKNHCRSSDNRRFHIALELWWTALRVTDIVMSSHLLRGAEISFCDLGGFGQNAVFAQVAVLFLADLCCLSSRFFQSRGVVPQESERAFPCTCVHDAWAMAADLIGRRHEHFVEEVRPPPSLFLTFD
ncbi:hypothetical protein HPB51_012558 [Rhipicephalus microplus]|uniref:Uncharacterized protein n=1 Tax=Rhipicephalus microplus TaxID=6941 RepID=A0A9J6DGL3_RHIMP|nr:hypothetical protein HPB51_012558 [Rhipicephalus microplus]